MRKWCGALFSAAMVLGLAAPSLGEPTKFDATFSLSLGSFPPFESTVTGGTLDATIASGVVTAFTLPGDIFKLTENQPLVPPVVVLTNPVKLTLSTVTVKAVNSAGNFNQADGKATFTGDSKLIFNKGDTVATIPLDNAIGTTSQNKAVILGFVKMTLDAEKWRVGTAKLTTVPLDGGPSKVITKTGSFDGVSKFLFVAPTQITINVPGGAPSKIASFGELAINIAAPEAANVLLLATGAAVLLLVGYRRSIA